MWWHFTASAELFIDAHFCLCRVEFTFTTYLNGTELVNAVQNLNYKGGNTRTGAGLKFVSDNFFNPVSSRDVPKVWGAVILWFFIISHDLVTPIGFLILPLSYPIRSLFWSQTGSHRTVWRNLHRSCAVKECMFLQLVGVSSAFFPVLLKVVWNYFRFAYYQLWSLFYLANFLSLLGIKSADRNELAQISSQPSSDFTSFVGDFKLLNTLLPLVTPRVCSKAGGVYASDGMCFNLRYMPQLNML